MQFPWGDKLLGTGFQGKIFQWRDLTYLLNEILFIFLTFSLPPQFCMRIFFQVNCPGAILACLEFQEKILHRREDFCSYQKND